MEQRDFALWGGTASVIVSAPDRIEVAMAQVHQVVADVDQACSVYRDDSDIARVNAAGGRPVPVGPTFLEVRRAAEHASEVTGGLVNPRPDGIRLDFGAIAKAFAADVAADRAAATADCGVLVALCGDVAMAGPVPEGGWRVRVADDHRRGPDGRLPDGQDVALHTPGGLATSSLTVRQRRLPSGEVVAHITDPRTGLPVRGPWRTVSVAAGSCVDANTATTAALVRGPDAADWLAGMGLPARLVYAEGWVRTVGGWPDGAES